MPAKSEKQRRLMCGVCHGSIKKKGLSKEAACEFCSSKAKKAEKGMALSLYDVLGHTSEESINASM